MNRGLCAFMAAGLLFAASATAAEECKMNILASVYLETLADGRIAVPVRVAGEPTYFLVELGVQTSSITAPLADKLKLSRVHTPWRFVGLDGRLTQTMAKVPNFNIGGLYLTDTEFVYDNLGFTYGPTVSGDITIGGAIGTDLLRAYDLDIDFGAKRLNIVTREGCGSDALYWHPAKYLKLPVTIADQHRIEFPVQLDGHNLQAVLDTGLPLSAVRAQLADSLLGVKNGPAGNEQVGMLDADTPLYAHTFKTLAFEGVSFADPKIIVMPDRIEPALRKSVWVRPQHSDVSERLELPEFLLGVAELRHFHVYIAFRGQAVFLTPVTKGGDFPARPAKADN